MAITVPTVDGPKVTESLGPGPRITAVDNPDVFNAGPSFARLTNAAQTVAFDEIKKAKNNANEMAANEATAEATRELTDTLYNPETGLYAQKGKNAAEAYSKAQETFSNRMREIEDGLSNDDQRRTFRNKSLQLNQNLYEAGGKHLASEISQYDLQTAQSRVASNDNLIASNPFDPSIMAQSIEDNKATVLRLAERNGWSEETKNEKLLETESKSRATGIEAMLNAGKYREAGILFSQSKELMTAKDRDHLEHAVREGDLRTQSQAMADDLFAKGASLSDGFKEIRKIEDPELRAKSYEAFKQVKQMDEMAKRDAAEQINIEVANILDQNGGDISKVPPSKFVNLSTSARSELQRYAATRQKGLEPKTDWSVYNKAITMASTPELQDKFLQTDLFVEYRNQMSDSEFKELVHLQSGLRKSDDRVKSQLDDYRTKNEIVSSMIGELGFKPKTEEANQFESAVTREQRAMQNQLGRKLTNEEMETIVKKQAMKVPNASWFTPNKRLYEYNAGNVVSDIPPNDRAQIEAALRKKGRIVNDANISAVYIENTRKSNGL